MGDFWGYVFMGLCVGIGSESAKIIHEMFIAKHLRGVGERVKVTAEKLREV